jgi:sensor histidine kinase YesM
MKNRGKFREPVIHAVIWICCYLLIVQLIKTIGPFKRADNTLLMPVTFGTVINIILFYMTSVLLIPGFTENRKTGKFLILLFSLLLSLTVFETVVDKAFFRYYYSNREEPLFSQMILNLILNIIILSLALGYGFTRNWYRNEKIKQSLIRDKLTAELNLLKTQLNPHFLFNVLNMAFSSASRSGDERTADIIEKLSALMRYTTYESSVEKIDLEKELEYIENYINLQKMRFSEEIPVKVKFQIKGNISDCRITPLILIQFVENTFKHGVKLGVESEIEITINVEDHRMAFITRNPVFVKTRSTGQNKTGIGIENVRKRLSILYPGRHTLEIGNTGQSFEVRLLMNLQ